MPYQKPHAQVICLFINDILCLIELNYTRVLCGFLDDCDNLYRYQEIIH